MPVWPLTSLGSPTSVMTELTDQWLAVTSCGSLGSVMCHQQCRLTGASLPVRVFSLCYGSTLGGWVVGCPSLRARGKFQEHYHHLIVCVHSSLTEILEAPQVSTTLHPWPKTTRWDSLLSLYLFSLFAYTCMCVHSSDPKLTPPSHPCGHLPPPGSHTHYQSPLMASN